VNDDQKRIDGIMERLQADEKREAEWKEIAPPVPPKKQTFSSIDMKTGKVLSTATVRHVDPPPPQDDPEYENYWKSLTQPERDSYEKSWRRIDDLIEKGTRNAMWYRGVCYCTGKMESPIDYRRARYYFKMAADLECADSQDLVSEFNAKSLGGATDWEEAWSYGLKAANYGHPRAMLRVGEWLINPPHTCIPKDPSRGRAFVLKSAEKEFLEAFKAMAILYKDAIGGAQDLSQAEAWLRKYEDGMQDKRKYPEKYQRRLWTKPGDRGVIGLSSIGIRKAPPTAQKATNRPQRRIITPAESGIQPVSPK
jgi:hypothetical protein